MRVFRNLLFLLIFGLAGCKMGFNPRDASHTTGLDGSGRNPEVVERILENPESFRGFFRKVCEPDDTMFYFKVRRATGYDYMGEIWYVTEFRMKHMAEPFYTWQQHAPLLLGYNSTELNFKVVHVAGMKVRRFCYVEGDNFYFYPIEEWGKEGLSCDRDSIGYRLKVSANKSAQMRGWLLWLWPEETTQDDDGLRYSLVNFLMIAQLPEQEHWTLGELKEASNTFVEDLHTDDMGWKFLSAPGFSLQE